jgi:signal transduction histidine kinase
VRDIGFISGARAVEFRHWRPLRPPEIPAAAEGVIVVASTAPPRARATSVRVGAACTIGVCAAVLVAIASGPTSFDGWAVARGVAVTCYVFAGAYTWWRRPASRLGPLLAAVGLFYAAAAAAVSTDPAVHSAGRVVLAAFYVAIAYLFLCFPYDRLAAAFDRRFMAWFTAVTLVVWLAALLVASRLPAGGPLTQCYGECPPNAARVVRASGSVTAAVSFLVVFVTVAAVTVTALRLGFKARATHVRRRLYRPVFAAAIGLALSTAAFALVRHTGEPRTAVRVVGAASAIAAPLAFLLGQIRGRLFAAAQFGGLLAQMSAKPVTAEHVQATLREALGDPSIVLARGRPGGGFVGADGAPVELPRNEVLRVATPIRGGTDAVGVLIHDGALDGSADVIASLGSAALTLLENADLAAELRASRARIVETAQTERLRLERNLHDGAQPHLLRIEMKLHELRRRLPDDDVAATIAEIEVDIANASAALASLAQGLYPAVLRERGVADALRAYALSVVAGVTVAARDVGRLPAPIEEAVYFCVLEAVQNAAKHGGDGTSVRIGLKRLPTQLDLTVADDGQGFVPAQVREGMGLVGMRDRIGSVGGDVAISSRPGAGTVVHALIPLAGAEPT